jgi:Tfp pilus assembly protein PilZ
MSDTEARRNPETTPAKSKPEDLRKSPRFRIENAKTELYLKGFLSKIGLNRKNEARVAVNLSEGGILVVTHRKMNPGEKVLLRIEMEKFKDVIDAEGEVRWCGVSAKDPSDFYVGISFVKLSQEKISRISQMRAWFTSPEFKAKSATRRRLAPPELLK